MTDHHHNNHHHHHHIFLSTVTVPVGAIIAFAGNVEKHKAAHSETTDSKADSFVTKSIESYGWMVCDGSPLESSKYPELYYALGNLYGGSEDKTTFNLPNLSGQFLRGIGTDKASTDSRTKAPGGQENGIGSTQLDAMQTHRHKYKEPTGAMPGKEGKAFAAITDAYTDPPTNLDNLETVKVSDFETRPTNVFVNYLIKYTYRLPMMQHTF